MFLEGIRVSGYRSFRSEAEFVGLSKINMIVGQNNSGKSNVLRLLTRHLPDVADKPREKAIPLGALDACVGEGPEPIKVSLYVSPKKLLHLIEREESVARLQEGQRRILVEPLLGAQMSQGGWLKYIATDGARLKIQSRDLLEFTHGFPVGPDFWRSLWQVLRSMRGGGEMDWRTEAAKSLDLGTHLVPSVDMIPALRSLRPYSAAGLSQENSVYYMDGIREHGGIGLIDELFELQNPVLGREKDRDRFDQINKFLQDVTGNGSIFLEIPHDKNTVVVRMDGKRLPIESLGSGIEEVLIIAAKSTIFRNQIVCLEEPEIHLHPALQKKLMIYLNEHTDNQYFITTHSAHLFDAVEGSIYHVRLTNGGTVVDAAINDSKKFAACIDLGYRASDILQSNSIIWVEGPSDRIYVHHWLRHVAPELVEGLHYTIMFYGGRLLSHLTGSDEAVEEFVRLQRLNRNMAIIIDSDRRKRGERINGTKTRIRKEFESAQNFVWITDGKEIENYVAEPVMKEAIKQCHPSAEMPEFGQYAPTTQVVFAKTRGEGSSKSIDKMKVAHWVVKQDPDFSVLDLKSRVDGLASFVRKCNMINV